jgi:TPR repeat protein
VKRDYKQALAWYRKAADQNLSDAEEEVGYFYQNGFGVNRDYAQALIWYHRAADHGSFNAENQLGYMAGEGWGQPQNYDEALSWCYKAADHGSDQAEENIGYMFQYGTGVSTDYAKAMSWFDQAAAQGNGDAENQIAWMYQHGQGVKQDDSWALSWYQLSAARGNINGERNLESFTEDLEEDGTLQNASAGVHGAAIEQAQRWANIQDLQHRIDLVETDALYQDSLVDQLEGMGQKKNGGVSKIFKAIGDVGSVKYKVLADKDRSDAANLRDQLARIASPSFATAPSP